MIDIIEVTQVGKVVPGNRICLGEFTMVGGKPKIKMGRKTVKLGDGLTLISAAGSSLQLRVTAAAAKRLGWPHPANTPKHTRADLPKLLKMLTSQTYGEQEQLQARNDLAELIPQLEPAEQDDARHVIGLFDRSPFRSAA